MITIGGSWILGNLVLAFGIVTVGMFGPIFLVAGARSERPVRLWDRPLVAAAGRWLLAHAGGRQQVIKYDWRYLDADGEDITEQMHTGTVEAVTAEAWQAGEKQAQLLLRVTKRGQAWRISPHGGLLGVQVDDAALWGRPFGDPFGALAAVAERLRFTAVEG